MKPFFLLIQSAVHRFLRDGCRDSAATLTYTTLFAVVPMMTVTFSLLSAIPSFQGIGEHIESFIFSHFVPAAGETLQTYLVSFSQQARKLTAVGVVFLIVTAFMMLRTVDKAINKVWHEDKVKRGVSGFLLYWAILSLGPFLLGLGFVLTSYLASLTFISDTTAYFGVDSFLLRLMPVLLSTLVLTLLYAAVPNRKVPLRYALTGSLLVATVLELAKTVFTTFIAKAPTYELVYGAFAAVPLFLFWIYLSWNLVLFGAVLVRNLTLSVVHQKAEDWPPVVELLVVLSLFREQFRQGEALNVQTGRKQWPLTEEDWEKYTGLLLQYGLICKGSQGELMLAQDLRQKPLAAFCQQLPWPMPGNQALTAIQCDGRPDWFAQLVKRLLRVNELKTQALSVNLDELYQHPVNDNTVDAQRS